MPKKKPRKKYPKLPSGFGSIRFLGSGRRNCYAVHPPATIDALGHVQRPAAICYTDDWIKGFTVLTAYKAGTYTPGMEKDLPVNPTNDTDILIQRIISDYSTLKGVEKKHPEIHEPTFKEVYENFFNWKYNDPKRENKYSPATIASTRAAYKNCSTLHNMKFNAIRVDELQNTLDSCNLKYGSLRLILILYHQMYKYAQMQEICEIDRSAFVTIKKSNDDEHGVPFSDEELKILWDNKTNEDVQIILIMIYSGFRISEYKTIKINLQEQYFQGGLKTDAGKNRIVPIHSAILTFVQSTIEKYGELIPTTIDNYRKYRFHPTLKQLGIKGDPIHTPHDCRHTFSKLSERYGISDKDRKRMMGHSLANDITNGIYGHRDLSDLRKEIEKIKVDIVTNCD